MSDSCCDAPISERDEAYVEAMAKEHTDDAPVSTPASQTLPILSIKNRCRNVEFSGKQGAYLATCDDPVFTILIIHEWWGLNDQIRSMADQFAGLGGAALAVDLYQTQPPASEVKEARKLMKKAMSSKDELLEHLQQSCRYLEQEYPNLKRATVGWCFGGMWALQASLVYPMDCTIIYYGHLVTEAAALSPLKGPLLGIFGALDKGIKLDHVKEFEEALQEAGKTHEICIIEGADHAFANPSSKLYNKDAADAAWKKVLSFLQSTVLC
mmetsp:Transcript_29690/g.62053  ORF Transcript_29690/g.62053 Transcript_29690/m.62053 type:complete len:268 (-) Transcript_29690:63-866(-)